MPAGTMETLLRLAKASGSPEREEERGLRHRPVGPREASALTAAAEHDALETAKTAVRPNQQQHDAAGTIVSIRDAESSGGLKGTLLGGTPGHSGER